MVNKQFLNSHQAPDGSDYVTLTDGVGNLLGFSPVSQVQGNATGTTGAVVGTLAAAAGKTTFISGFNISAIGSALGSIGPIVIAGLAGGSQTYQFTTSTTASILQQSFTPPLAASAVNTAITVTTTADATATAVDVNVWGYQQ